MAKKVGRKVAFFAIFFVIIFGLASYFLVLEPHLVQTKKIQAYNEATILLKEKDYARASGYFKKAEGYLDACLLYKHTLAYSKSESPDISAKVSHTAVLRSNNTVVCVGYQEFTSYCLDTKLWTNIIAVSTGEAHTVGLKNDGTVIATNFAPKSKFNKGQCDVQSWENIVQISANSYYTLGLKENGSVAFAGECDGIEEVSKWKDIVAISAGGNFAIGLTKHGTVVSTPIANSSENFGQSETGSWKNVTQISAGKFHSVGLTKSGGVLACGNNNFSQINTLSFADIDFVCATHFDTYLLTKSGEIIGIGANPLTLEQSAQVYGAKSISGGYNYVCFCLPNGERVAFGDNSQNQCAIGGIQK